MDFNDEMMFSQFTDAIGKWLEVPKAFAPKPERLKPLIETVKKLQTIIDEEMLDCKVKAEPAGLQVGDAVVWFESYDFCITDISRFYDAIKELSNFEMYITGEHKIRFAGIFPDAFNVIPLNDIDK